MRRITIASAKGGTAKTTTAVNLSVYLAREGYRTLLIDCDGQSNASDNFLGTPINSPGLFGFLVGDVEFRRAGVSIEENLDLLPGSQALGGIDGYLLAKARSTEVLKRKLQGLTGYDFLVCDTPPSLPRITLNAIMACDELVVPCSMEYFALNGLKQTLSMRRILHEETGHKIRLCAVLPTVYDMRNKKSAIILKFLEERFSGRVASPIRTSVRLSEAPSHHKSIFDYAPESTGAADYRRLGGRILHDATRAPWNEPVGFGE